MRCSIRRKDGWSMFKTQRALCYGLVALAMTLAPVLAVPARAEVGTVAFEIAKASFIVGVGGGSGPPQQALA